MKNQNYSLLINTKDSKGLVYQVSKVLYDHSLNIEQNAEYVDNETNKFFMRTVISGSFNHQKLLVDLKDALPDNATVRLKEKAKKDIVILITKESHVLGDLLIRYIAGELNANILAIIANHNDLEGLVNKFNIPFHFISTKDISRESHEELITKKIDKYQPELIVLAKYMRILTPTFVNYFSNKILNIHHSFLPAFIGANPYKQAHIRGVKIIGATAHYVTAELDQGPIISQNTVRVNHSDSWQEMRRAGRDVEKIVLSDALQLLLEDKVFIHGNKTIIL